MRFFVRALAVLVACGGLGVVSTSKAGAADIYPCGKFQHRTATATFKNGTVNLFRTGRNWCAYTARTGKYYGHVGTTIVVYAGPESTGQSDSGRYKYFAGPIYWTASCGQIIGAVGNKNITDGGVTNNYCVSSN